MPRQAHRGLTDRLKHLAAFAALATLLLTCLCIPGASALSNDPWLPPPPPPDDNDQALECVQGTTLSYFYASPSTIEPEQSATLVWVEPAEAFAQASG